MPALYRPPVGILTVQWLYQAWRGHDLALAPLLEEINRTQTLYPGTSLRLVYEIPRTIPVPGEGLSAALPCRLGERDRDTPKLIGIRNSEAAA